ncbi:MAG: SDR family NAD(P)-dependent oxidoreductase [Proteobacteria bacterium]|nr:MAG: SDR family NAD(P)-dependent oxidoreductase [Pseudomonadota bacterium]
MTDFSNKSVLVTGATSGLGEAIALGFAARGARLTVTGRDTVRGDRLVARLGELGGIGSFIAGDITDRGFCDALVEQAASRFGGLDICVNSAGVIHHATIDRTSDSAWHETLAVNVNAVFYVCRAAVRAMLPRKRGVIVNLASDAGLSGSEHLVAYCASKGAVIQMSRAMARDLGGDGIRVIPVCPGDVDTPMLRGEFEQRGTAAQDGLEASAAGVPAGRVCTPREVAELVLYAASDAARFMTGYPLVLDGGGRAERETQAVERACGRSGPLPVAHRVGVDRLDLVLGGDARRIGDGALLARRRGRHRGQIVGAESESAEPVGRCRGAHQVDETARQHVAGIVFSGAAGVGAEMPGRLEVTARRAGREIANDCRCANRHADAMRHERRRYVVPRRGDVFHKVGDAVGHGVGQVCAGVAEGHAGKRRAPHQLIARLVVGGVGNAAFEVGVDDFQCACRRHVAPRVGALQQRSPGGVFDPVPSRVGAGGVTLQRVTHQVVAGGSHHVGG